MTNEMTYGDKYEATRNLDVAQIAKLIRADIKAAIKAGELPEITTSVKIQRYSGGQSINVKITAVPSTFAILNPERVKVDHEQPHVVQSEYMCPRYTPAAKVVEDRIESIVEAYNYDGSDSMRDHFNVRFYSHVDYAHDLEARHRAATLAIASERDSTLIAHDAVCLRDMARALAVISADAEICIKDWRNNVTCTAAELAPTVVGLICRKVAELEAKRIPAPSLVSLTMDAAIDAHLSREIERAIA